MGKADSKIKLTVNSTNGEVLGKLRCSDGHGLSQRYGNKHPALNKEVVVVQLVTRSQEKRHATDNIMQPRFSGHVVRRSRVTWSWTVTTLGQNQTAVPLSPGGDVWLLLPRTVPGELLHHPGCGLPEVHHRQAQESIGPPTQDHGGERNLCYTGVSF